MKHCREQQLVIVERTMIYIGYRPFNIFIINRFSIKKIFFATDRIDITSQICYT